MPIDETLIFGGLSIAILILLFIYVISRDKATKKRLNSYEKSIEAINKHLYKIDKKIEERVGDKISKEDMEQIREDIGKEIKDPIYKSLENIKESIHLSKSDVESRMGNLEEKAKEYMSIPISASMDESRVVSLFKNGYTPQDIAKEMRSNVSEVNFLLKVKGLA